MTKHHRISRNLAHLMKVNNLTARQLYEALEGNSSITSMKQLGGFKENRNEPNIDCVRDLSKFFGLTMEEFCYEDLKNK